MPRRHHKTSARARTRREPAAPQDEQGLRLDAARAEFRAAWQAQVDRKRRQAKRLRGVAEVIRRNPLIIPLTGGRLGAASYGTVLLLKHFWLYLPFGVLIGFIGGFALAFPLIPAGPLVAQLCKRWAKRCEQSADRMEPTRRRSR